MRGSRWSPVDEDLLEGVRESMAREALATRRYPDPEPLGFDLDRDLDLDASLSPAPLREPMAVPSSRSEVQPHPAVWVAASVLGVLTGLVAFGVFATAFAMSAALAG